METEIENNMQRDYEDLIDLRNRIVEPDTIIYEEDRFTLDHCLDYLELFKKQLAEKDKQIKNLNLEAQKYYEDAYCNDFHNQDKISFAVEQLEKVKEYTDEVWWVDGVSECVVE